MTRGFYREDRALDPLDDRAMVTSASEMRREEARSRRVGRAEDAIAEREELARINAKEAKLARARSQAKAKRRKARSGGSGRGQSVGAAFLDDGGGDDDDDDDLELSG